MNLESNYTVSELIYLFVDGEATIEEKKNLFLKLSANPELANEFRYAFAMQKFAINEIAIAPPPVSLTNSLFTRAGFKTSVLNNVKFNFLKSKTFIAILCSAISSLATFLLLNHQNLENNKTEGVKHRECNYSINAPIEKNIKNKNAKNIINNRSYERKSKTGNIEKEINITDIAQVRTIDNHKNETPIKYIDNKPENINKQTVINQMFDNQNNLNNSILAPEEENPKKIIFSFGSNQGIFLSPNRKFSKSSGSIIDNLDISANFEISEGSFIGPRIIRENFPIEAQNLSGKSATAAYLLSCGINLTKYFDNLRLFNQLTPILETYAGASSYGIPTKLDLCLDWKPEEKFSFKIGLSTTAMFYYKNNKLQNAEKFGLIYSLNYTIN